ncbi:hypothetical protein NQ317_003020 [Molorchus minor]|uniref:Uncharacterized protein n=1 Tax=Molorchus minor TaxID=1323400 RepID=A0ABQ9IVD0_9CUCU|nr:hypothetical protein NQ317_003020 [Molorchus minor]
MDISTTAPSRVRKDYSLLIHSVQLHNLGVYTCQAYNGLGKAASWAVTVKAIGPYYFTDPEELKYKPYIVNPPEDPTTTTTPQPSPPMWPQPPPLRPTFAPWIPPAYNEPEPPNEIIPDTIPPPVAEGGVVPPLQIGAYGSSLYTEYWDTLYNLDSIFHNPSRHFKIHQLPPV